MPVALSVTPASAITHGLHHVDCSGVSFQHFKDTPMSAFIKPLNAEMTCLPTQDVLDRSESSQSSIDDEVQSVVSVVAREIDEATRQQWRLNTVPGRVVVFVSAGYEGKRFVFELAHQMQLRVAIIDAKGSWSEKLVEEGLADEFIPLDIQHLDDITMNACKTAINSVKESFGRLDAILSFCELAQPLAAQLAAAFGLPGNSPESVLAAREKHISREMFDKAGLPNAKFFCIQNDVQIEEAANYVGFPAVLKPVSGAASIGVIRVDNLASLRDRLLWVRKQLTDARVVNGALQEGTEDYHDSGCTASGWIDTDVMLEEYLDGQEVDIDIIMSNGESYYEAVTDNWPTVEPYFNETVSNCPSQLSTQQQDELKALAVASCKALGLTVGVFHVEGKYTSRGPRIIEVNCRMGGGSVYLTNRLVFGVDLAVEQLILSSGGAPFPRNAISGPLCAIAESTVTCPRSGYVQHVDFLTPWQNHPRVMYAQLMVHCGQHVVGPDTGMPTWLCDVMVTASTVDKAVAFMQNLEATMEYPIADNLP